MSVEDRLRKALSTLEQAGREQEEQRALRDRRVAEAREQAGAGFQKEVTVATRYAEHMAELNKRQKEAGGWVTGKTLSDKGEVMGLGAGEDETAEKQESYDVRPPAAHEPPRAVDDWEGPQAQESLAPAPSPPEPESAPSAPAPRRRARHAREDGFDDDDFSNNTWMVD